ncbi:MAG: TonB-dependent receptor, partial [Alistipes sp.]|nr:TonB-dependent receptor [Alistipes sp.]
DRISGGLKLGAKAGYIHTRLGYDYSRDLGNGQKANMIRSRSRVDTFYASFDTEYSAGRKWLFTANVAAHQHFVRSEDRNIIKQDGSTATVGYDKARIELSGYVSAKWRPIERFGISAALREEMYGREWTPVIPALFIDAVLSEKWNVIAKASVSRNFRFPTLNDLYFLPGGNPDLKKEHGATYDCGVEFTVGKAGRYKLHGEVAWFDSHIDDWIVWLPSFKGFWEPKNIKKVHAYGIELKGSLGIEFNSDWALQLDANFSWTPSINNGDPINWADEAIGKQLVYVPRISAAVNGVLTYGTWSLGYKWCHYGERFTTSSNETATKIGKVLPYYMSDVALEKKLPLRWAELSLKMSVRNLFDEEYESVLSHPMPGINCEFFIGIRPEWGKRK